MVEKKYHIISTRVPPRQQLHMHHFYHVNLVLVLAINFLKNMKSVLNDFLCGKRMGFEPSTDASQRFPVKYFSENYFPFSIAHNDKNIAKNHENRNFITLF